jgi:hypothetical protein
MLNKNLHDAMLLLLLLLLPPSSSLMLVRDTELVLWMMPPSMRRPADAFE